MGHVVPRGSNKPLESARCLIKSLGETSWIAGPGCITECGSCRNGFFIGPRASKCFDSDDMGRPLWTQMSRWLPALRGLISTGKVMGERHRGAGPRVLGINRVAQDAILIPWRAFISGGSQLEDDPSGFQRMPESALARPGCRLSLSRLSLMSRTLHQALAPLPSLRFFFL